MVGLEPISFAEDAGLIFIYVEHIVYMIHLVHADQGGVRERDLWLHFVYTNFCSPGTATVSDVAHLNSIFQDVSAL
jgi:hypothetical protein